MLPLFTVWGHTGYLVIQLPELFYWTPHHVSLPDNITVCPVDEGA